MDEFWACIEQMAKVNGAPQIDRDELEKVLTRKSEAHALGRGEDEDDYQKSNFSSSIN